MRHGKTRADQLRALERREFALTLRRAGARYRQIASEVIKRFGAENVPKNYDERQAYQDVAAILKQTRARVQEIADEVRDLELQRLDELLTRLWPLTQRRTDDGGPDLKAIDRIIHIMEQRGRLVPGLEAPQRFEPEGEWVLHVVHDDPNGGQQADAAPSTPDSTPAHPAPETD